MGGLAGGLIGGWSHMVFGVAKTAVDAIFGGISTLLNGVVSLISSILTAGFKGIFVVLGGITTGLVDALKSAIGAATEFSKAALSLRASTGVSYRGAGALLTRGLAFGMSPGDTANSYKNQNLFTDSRSQAPD